MITRKTLLLGMGLCILWPSSVWADVETLRPNASGDICGFPWGCVSCPDHYQCVDEAVSDGDATELHSTCTYGYCGELYNMEDSYGPYGIISRITVYARFKSNVDPSRTSAYIQISTGGTVYSGSEVTVTTSWADYSYEWTTNPKTGTTWNWTDIDALQIGSQMRRPHESGVGIYTYCTQLYVIVEYSGSCEPAAITSGATGGGTVTEGDPGPFVFTVTTSGDPAPTYQWKRAGLDGGDVYDEAGHISGATTDTLTITNVEVTDEGDYTCVASNICGYEESAPATLIVNWAPTIETLRPNAPGDVCSVTFQTGAACPDHYLNVDDVTSDEDATKVHATSTPGYTADLYNIDDPGMSFGVITKLVVYARFKRSLTDQYGNSYTPTSSAIVEMKTGGTVYQGGSYLVPTDWTDYSEQWTINPKTGVAWTWPDIVNLQIGVQLRRAASSGIGIYTYCTQTYARVYYEPAAGACCHPSGSCLDETETHCIDDYNGYWLGAGTTCAGQPDCNDNSILDECEIANGVSPDCNNNGVPDECDVGNIEVIDLGVLAPGDSSEGCGVNNAGQVIGMSGPYDEGHAFLWEDGVMTGLGVLTAGDQSRPHAINSLGQVVGQSGNPYGDARAFLWLPSPAYGLPAGMNDLGVLYVGDEETVAYDINDAGQVVGKSGPRYNGYRAFLWLPSPAYGFPAGMNDLGALSDDGLNCSATAINDGGEVVGSSLVGSTSDWHPFLWLPSSAHGLPAGLNDLGSFPGGSDTFASDINNAGQVVGDGEIADVWSNHVFLWENGMMTDLGTLGGEESWCPRINNIGQIVGEAQLPGEDGDWSSFLYMGGVMYDLNDLIPDGSDWVLYDSDYNGINDAGWIVGRGENPNGDRGFLYKRGIYVDCDDNGVPDTCELEDNDCNTNGVLDECDIAAGESEDCNTNGIPDECDIDPDWDGTAEFDCNGNEIFDGCEADGDTDGVINACDNCPAVYNPNQGNADGDSAGDVCDGCPDDANKIEPGQCGCGVADTDTDNDGLADCVDPCPARKPGDVSGNGSVDWGDVSPFVTVLLNPAGATADERCAADMDGLGTPDGADIQGFVTAVLPP